MNGYFWGIILMFVGAFGMVAVNTITQGFDPIPFYIGLIGCALCWIVEAFRSQIDKIGVQHK